MKAGEPRHGYESSRMGSLRPAAELKSEFKGRMRLVTGKALANLKQRLLRLLEVIGTYTKHND